MKPKVFFIINTLQGGGAERVITNLANYFDLKKYKVALVCLNSAPVTYKTSSGIRIYHLVKRTNESNFIYEDSLNLGILSQIGHMPHMQLPLQGKFYLQSISKAL